jgi:hypothetical protein
MPMALPTNLWQEAKVAIPTRTCNAMDVVRLVTLQRTAGKRNPMHTSDHQDGNHPKKLELSALMSEGATTLNSFCADCR